MNTQASGPWILSRSSPVEAGFGWKLHLSATPSSLPLLLQRTLPLLKSLDVPHKTVVSAEVLKNLNGGDYGEPAIGKALVVYPDRAVLRSLATELVQATQAVEGPTVVTSYWLGGAVYTRFGVFNADPIFDRFGALTRAYIFNGKRVDDPYLVPSQQPTDWPFEQAPRLPQVDFGALLDEFRLLTVLRRRATGNVVLAEDRAGCRVVIKQVRHHTLQVEREFAALSRVYPEWRSQLRLLEAPAGRFLVMPALQAKPFSSQSFEDTLSRDDLWRSIRQEVTRVHSLGLVHGDVSPNNLLFEQGRCWLVDYGQAGRPGEPSQGFTPGFATLARRQPDSVLREADDWYGAATSFLYLCSGLHPDSFTQASTGAGIAHGIESVDERLDGDRIAQFLLDTSKGFVEVPTRLDRELTLPRTRNSTGIEEWDPSWAVEMLQRAPATPEGLWLSTGSDTHGGASELLMSAATGVAGALYLIARLCTAGADVSELVPRVEFALDWLLDAPTTRDARQHGLCYGSAGVALVTAELVQSGCVVDSGWLRNFAHHALAAPPDWPDVTHGAAGQLIACVRLYQVTQDLGFIDRASRLVDFLLVHQRPDGAFPLPAGVEGIAPGTCYSGFAHGASGVGYALLLAAKQMSHDRAFKAATRAGDWLRNAKGDRDWSELDVEARRNAWCHGAPGISLLFAEFAAVDATYRSDWLDVVDKLSHRASNLSTCCGSTGFGEVMLTHVRQPQARPEWSTKVIDVARRLKALGQRDGWLMDGHRSADLLKGSSGPAHFLLRSSNPTIPLGFPLL